MQHCILSIALVLTYLVPAVAGGADGSPQPGTVAPGSVKFVVHRVGTFRSEVCGVADFNGDGRPDVVSAFWHEKRTSWFRNIGLAGQLWPEDVIEENGKLSETQAVLAYEPLALRSEAVHVTQVGFRPDDPVKLGFLSCWMGSGGGLLGCVRVSTHLRIHRPPYDLAERLRVGLSGGTALC